MHGKKGLLLPYNFDPFPPFQQRLLVFDLIAAHPRLDLISVSLQLLDLCL